MSNPSEQPPKSSFYSKFTLEELAAQQGVGPIDLDSLRKEFGDLWPDDISIQDFQSFLSDIRESESVRKTSG